MPITNFLLSKGWLANYSKATFVNDLIAAIVVVVLLIPQSLAYAMLAGVPAEVGLYSSILPLAIYGLLGSSRTLSVGPVAIISLMTASSLGAIIESGIANYLVAASTLALLSGGMLLIMGLARLGFIANFLSSTVISGFITASAIVIIVSQLKHILGVDAEGNDVVTIIHNLFNNAEQTNIATVFIGMAIIVLLWLFKYIPIFLINRGVQENKAKILARLASVTVIIASIFLVYIAGFEKQGVAVLGDVPGGFNNLKFSLPSWALIKALLIPAFLISMIGYVESIAVAKVLASKRRQTVNLNQELIGLGLANIGSFISHGIPVTGGISRSIVNFDAGAVTQLSSIMAAIGMAIAIMFLTPYSYYLPKAALAATIIVAIVSLIDFKILKKTWNISKKDFFAVLITIVITLVSGVEVGVSCGIVLSLLLHLYTTSKPHIAEIGLVGDTQHFRNIKRYKVKTLPHTLMLRPDESLFFANINYLESKILSLVFQRDEISDVVILCSAVNEIDFSAMETLSALNLRLQDQGIKLHLSEVKGPVITILQRYDLIENLSGKIYLSNYEAFKNLEEGRYA